MESIVLRQQIRAIVARMDAIADDRDPTEQELAYYPWALQLAKGRLYDLELRGKTMKMKDGTEFTWN